MGYGGKFKVRFDPLGDEEKRQKSVVLSRSESINQSIGELIGKVQYDRSRICAHWRVLKRAGI